MFVQKAAFVASLFALFSLSGAVAAAETDPHNRPHDLSTRDITAMQACRSRCLKVLNQAGAMIREIDEAKASNDIDKMRAALERARTVFVDAQNTQDECMALRFPGSSERARKLMEEHGR